MFRTTRAPTAFAALLVLVLGLLVGDVRGERAVSAVSAGPVASASTAAAGPVASVAPASAGSVASVPAGPTVAFAGPVVSASAGPSVAPAGPVVSASAGPSVAPAGPLASAPAGSSVPSAGPPVSAPGGGVPGCDPGRSVVAGADGPVVPPRAHGFAELLPALAADRAPGGARCVAADGREPAPGREPPDLVPPSPVELSVLRV